MTSKHFLLLQGVATPFFNELGKTIERNGHQVTKLNFCGGDLLFSKDLTSINVNKKLNELNHWSHTFIEENSITDAILFGDTRPIHQAILSALKSKNITIHVYEEGYIRPHWVTLEKDGVNGFSSYNQMSLEQWHEKALQLPSPTPPKKIASNMVNRAFYDLTYRLATGLLYPKFSHYQTHRPLNGVWEYLGWIKRFSSHKLSRTEQDKKTIQHILKNQTEFYVLPLQLESDAQIHTHSSFKTVGEVINTVIESFVKYAPTDSVLVIKNHPLSTGIPNHEKKVKSLAEKFDITARIIFLETGDLTPLLKKTRGTVLVNSTTATLAIQLGSPTIALGNALFDLPGLTFQGPLDQFWTQSTQPDQQLYNSYRRVLIQNTQINGDFYSPEGIAMTIRNSLETLAALPVSPIDITQNILITGASKGIGEALAYHYASRETRLILVARNPEQLARVGDGCRHLGADVIIKAIDVGNEDSLAEWIGAIDQEFPLDLLITNAGVTLASNPDGSLESLRKSRELLQINLNGTINAVNPIAERMRQRGKGQVAMVSSLAAYYGMPVNPIYSASKAAIKSYAQALRGLLKDQGVKVNVICPGFVETDLSQQFPGKRPFMISAHKAASLIAQGLEKNKAVIAFPTTLALGMKGLQLLPFPIASFFLGLSGFNRANKVLEK